MKTNEDSAGFKLTVTRVINAPCAMVYRAWTEPKQMLQWFSPRDVECRSIDMDLKIGGAYRVHFVSKMGDHIATGKYTEIVPNKRLRFTWEWQNNAMPNSVVTVDFEDLGATTRLTLLHEGLPSQEEADHHSHGWSSMAEKFAGFMEQKNK
jgi:uncharacterized protein YndB with AHSA1/START domain